MENICQYLTLVRRFHSRSLEEPGFSLVSELLNAVLIFMTSNSRVRNPHLRARLAECLDCLLPHADEDSSITNSIGTYYRKMLFLKHPHRKQVRNILILLVNVYSLFFIKGIGDLNLNFLSITLKS